MIRVREKYENLNMGIDYFEALHFQQELNHKRERFKCVMNNINEECLIF